jgi:hypothetical protein
VEASSLPGPAKPRVTSAVLATVPEKDGRVDEPALREATAAAITAEADYLKSAAPAQPGVHGFGATATNTAEALTYTSPWSGNPVKIGKDA